MCVFSLSFFLKIKYNFSVRGPAEECRPPPFLFHTLIFVSIFHFLKMVRINSFFFLNYRGEHEVVSRLHWVRIFSGYTVIVDTTKKNKMEILHKTVATQPRELHYFNKFIKRNEEEETKW